MKKTISLKSNGDFKRLYYKGKSIATFDIVLYYKKLQRYNLKKLTTNVKYKNALGITATKKIGNAVERNRATRLIKAAYISLEDKILDGYEVVIVARNQIVSEKMQDVKKNLNYALKKAGLIFKKE